MKRLEERVALITGAASGIGRVTAARLASEGAVAVVTDVQDALGEEAAAEISSDGGKASFVHHDVTSETEWQAAVERVLAEHGRLDILVNNAGMGDLAPIEETTMEDYARTIAIDQTGVFLGIRSVVPAMTDPHQCIGSDDKRGAWKQTGFLGERWRACEPQRQLPLGELRGAMRSLGYRTQNDLAQAIGVSRSAVSLWLEGKVGVPRPVAMLLRMLVNAQRRVY